MLALCWRWCWRWCPRTGMGHGRRLQFMRRRRGLAFMRGAEVGASVVAASVVRRPVEWRPVARSVRQGLSSEVKRSARGAAAEGGLVSTITHAASIGVQSSMAIVLGGDSSSLPSFAASAFSWALKASRVAAQSANSRRLAFQPRRHSRRRRQCPWCALGASCSRSLPFPPASLTPPPPGSRRRRPRMPAAALAAKPSGQSASRSPAAPPGSGKFSHGVRSEQLGVLGASPSAPGAGVGRATVCQACAEAPARRPARAIAGFRVPCVVPLADRRDLPDGPVGSLSRPFWYSPIQQLSAFLPAIRASPACADRRQTI